VEETSCSFPTVMLSILILPKKNIVCLTIHIRKMKQHATVPDDMIATLSRVTRSLAVLDPRDVHELIPHCDRAVLRRILQGKESPSNWRLICISLIIGVLVGLSLSLVAPAKWKCKLSC
jgi:hypothetical protein